MAGSLAGTVGWRPWFFSMGASPSDATASSWHGGRVLRVSIPRDRPDAGALPCETLACGGRGQGRAASRTLTPWVPSESLQARRGRQHCRLGRDTRAGPREPRLCSDHCGGSQAPWSRSLPLRALPGLTSGDPQTLHCQGEASAPLRARPPCTHPEAQQE